MEVIARTGQEAEIDNLPRPPHPLEEAGLVRKDQEVQKKTLSISPLPCEGNVPACVGMESSPKTLLTGKTQLCGRLPRPLDGPPLLEEGFRGLTDCSISRMNPPKDGLPRPSYQAPKSLLPRPCRSKSSIPVG